MKRVAVVIATSDPARHADALRASIGLGLRGDEVETLLLTSVSSRPITQALSVLERLGRPARSVTNEELFAALECCSATEIWS